MRGDYNELIDEMQQERKRQKLLGIWNRFGVFIIAIIAIFLLSVALFSWNTSRQTKIRIYYSNLYEDGRSYLAQGNGSKGIQILEEVANNANNSYRSMSRFAISEYLWTRKNVKKAYESFKIVANDKKSKSFYRGLAKLNMYRIDLDQKNLNYDEMLPKIESLIYEHPEVKSFSLELKGHILYEKKDYQKSRDIFLELAQLKNADQGTQKRAQAAVKFITINHLRKKNEN